MLKKLVSLLAAISIAMAGTAVMAENNGTDVVGYWSFDSVDNFIVPDESGNGHDGTIINGAYQIAGCKGKALEFGNGYQSTVMLPVGTLPEALNGASGVTVSSWVKFMPPAASGSQYILNTPITGKSGGLEIYLSAKKLRIAARSTSGDKWAGSVYAYPTPNVWTHMAVVFDFAGNAVKLYINGEPQEAESTGAFAFNGTYQPSGAADADYIGGSANAAARFDGQLDEFKIYRKALSDAEIKLDAAEIQDADSEGLFLRYNMEGMGTSVTDTSGKRVTGELKNEAVYDTGFYGSGVLVPAKSDPAKPNAISIPANTIGKIMNGKEAMTFSAKVLPEGTTKGYFYRILHLFGGNTGYVEAALCYVGDIPGLRVVAKSCEESKWAFNFYPYNFIENTGKWVNITVTFDYANGKVKAYFDGAEVSPKTENISASTLKSTTWVSGNSSFADFIGGTNNSSSISEAGLCGKIDNVYMYSRLLSDEEILKLAGAETKITAEYTGGKATVTLNNNSPDKFDYVVIAATYNDQGYMTAVEIKPVHISYNESRTVPMTLAAGENETIKAFVWDNLKSMKPIMR
ncbi:MAG: laminin G domain-containing protein [Clostridia bacterium]|nr:laminin G domain-containing protein [Clostridia bacterium]